MVKNLTNRTNQIEHLIEKYQITDVYLMAALLSATAEKNPAFAWDLNMNSLFHVLNLAKAGKIKKIFWPSSIAVFGPTTPRENTPQYTIMEPTTVYGISKQTGERWCEYYHHSHCEHRHDFGLGHRRRCGRRYAERRYDNWCSK